jgi:riboflavin synthase
LDEAMFTGIVDHCGEIREKVPTGTGIRLHVACRFSDLVLGESVSVDGACLTVITQTPEGFWCDLSEETLRLTRAGSYGPGQRVNLERALRLGDRLGGHIVTGHVDRTVTVESRREVDGFIEFRFGSFAPGELGYLVPKGSVALNGVSLTLNEVTASQIAVMLIPHTLEITNLSGLRVGDRVNVEFDWMTKLILNDVRRNAGLLGKPAFQENRP